jgi:hypothetical protein
VSTSASPAPTLRIDEFRGDGLGSLFHHPDFHRLHAPAGGMYAEAFDAGGRVLACFHATPQADGWWRSPSRGTYAGYVLGADLSLTGWAQLHGAVETCLRERGAQGLDVLLAPMAHDPRAGARQSWLLASLGYEAYHWDLNYTLALDARSFEERISRGNAKRLRKCRREGFAARRLDAGRLADVHALLAANRARHGHVLSMDLDQVATMQARFPDRLLLYGCFAADAAAPCAAAICMKLTPSVLYVYAWGDHPGFEAQSPVVTLAEAIHDDGRSQGIALLDLGTATLGADANEGLIHFKEGLDCETSLKLRMRKRFGDAHA